MLLPSSIIKATEMGTVCEVNMVFNHAFAWFLLAWTKISLPPHPFVLGRDKTLLLVLLCTVYHKNWLVPIPWGRQKRQSSLIRWTSHSNPNVLQEILIYSSTDNVALEVNTLDASKTHALIVFCWSPHTGGILPHHQDTPGVDMRQHTTKQFNHILSLGLHMPATVPQLLFSVCTAHPLCAKDVT